MMIEELREIKDLLRMILLEVSPKKELDLTAATWKRG